MRPANEVIDKIKQILGLKNDIELARYLRLKQSTVATWRKRKNIPYDVLFHFCYDHDIDPIWLAGGKISKKYVEIDDQKVFTGVITREESEQVENVKALVRERDEAVRKVAEFLARENIEHRSGLSNGMEETGFAAIPVYTTEVEAGLADGEDKGATEFAAIKKTWIQDGLKADPAALAIFRIGGDSMEPTLRPGDFVLIDKNCSVPGAGGIYILKLADTITCRRVQVRKGRTILVRTDNSLYEPISVDLRRDKGVVLMGRVIWMGRRVV